MTIALQLIFIVLITQAGLMGDQVHQEWVAREAGPLIDIAEAIVLDAEGNVYVTGSIDHTENTDTGDYGTIKYDRHGHKIWVARYDGQGGRDRAKAIVVDGEGNVYVTGWSQWFHGPDKGYAFATVKYSRHGHQLWMAQYPGPRHRTNAEGQDNTPGAPLAMVLDAEGYIYVSGPSVSERGTDDDYATIKYHPANGRSLWQARYNGPGSGDDTANALALDAQGNVYVTGSSDRGTHSDYVTIKYGSNSELIWIATYDGPVTGDDSALAVTVDREGFVYVTGTSSAGNKLFDYATIKYDSMAAAMWVARYAGGSIAGEDQDQMINALIMSDAEGHVYVGVEFGIGNRCTHDYGTIKYNGRGDPVWIARFDGSGQDADKLTGMVIDSHGNVYVTGSSRGGPGPCRAPGANFDYATVKYDSDGHKKWVALYNGPANRFERPADIAVDDEGNVYVTGNSEGGATMRDYFTIKYSQR